MTQKPTFEQLEPIALEFVKALLVQDKTNDIKTLSKKAMQMAVDWYCTRSDRQEVVDSNFIDWVNLNNLTDEELQEFLKSDEEFWVIGKSLGNRDIVKFKGVNSPVLPTSSVKALFKNIKGECYEGLYAYPASGYIYNDAPKEPKDVKLTLRIPVIRTYY